MRADDAQHEADGLVRLLELQPHPEGGWYRETWRAPTGRNEHAAGTAIYFLLRAGERSHWHRLDATEIWHHYTGDALQLQISADGRSVAILELGADLTSGQRPQAIVPPGAWQAARSLGAWTLVGCTVSPAFEFAGFELAPAGWEPSGA